VLLNVSIPTGKVIAVSFSWREAVGGQLEKKRKISIISSNLYAHIKYGLEADRSQIGRLKRILTEANSVYLIKSISIFFSFVLNFKRKKIR
jgi:hypothetical protein